MLPKATVALHGGCFTENFGDELLIAIHSKWVRQITDSQVVLPYGVKVYDEQVHALNVKGIEALKSAKKLIYSGGGYLGEPNHNQISWGFSFFKRKHFLPAEYFHFNKKPYAIIGAGAGPLTNIFTRKEVVRMCKHAEILAVRDDESANYLAEYGVPQSKIKVTADLVLSLGLEDIENRDIEKAKDLLRGGEGKKLVGIHLGISKTNENYASQAVQIIDTIVDFFNNNPDFVPVLIADKRNSSEQNLSIQEIGEKLIREYIVYKHSDIWLTCAVLSQLECVVTTKLHVGITAYSLGTRALSLAAHNKTVRFFKQIQQEENCIPLEQLNDLAYFQSKLHSFITMSQEKSQQEITLRQQIKERSLENKRLTEKYLIGK